MIISSLFIFAFPICDIENFIHVLTDQLHVFGEMQIKIVMLQEDSSLDDVSALSCKFKVNPSLRSV